MRRLHTGKSGKISVMADKMKPTLWRTARALCNVDRLKLMHLVANGRGVKGVVELANEAGLPVPTASTYLRALNARGLISVVRAGSFVYYGMRSDRSLPAARDIQRAFRSLFARAWLPNNWPERLLPLLNAYANARRIEIIRTIAAYQPIGYAELRRRCGICETSFVRHLRKVTMGGVIIRDDAGRYLLARQANSLEAALLAAL